MEGAGGGCARGVMLAHGLIHETNINQPEAITKHYLLSSIMVANGVYGDTL